MCNGDCCVSVIFITVLLSIFWILSVGMFFVRNEVIDSTGEVFCSEYGLLYDGFERVDLSNGEKMIQFNCVNETAIKVDAIGRLITNK